MNLTEQQQKDIFATVVASVAMLTTQQSIVLDLLTHKLPDVAREERQALINSAKNNLEISLDLQKTLELVRRL